MIISAAIHTSSTAFSALIWWTVPVAAVLGAIGYVVWVAKFQDKFENDTNRSVAKFSEFQRSFNEPSGVEVKAAPGSPVRSAHSSNTGTDDEASAQPSNSSDFTI